MIKSSKEKTGHPILILEGNKWPVSSVQDRSVHLWLNKVRLIVRLTTVGHLNKRE